MLDFLWIIPNVSCTVFVDMMGSVNCEIKSGDSILATDAKVL